jgi:spore coat protein H
MQAQDFAFRQLLKAYSGRSGQCLLVIGFLLSLGDISASATVHQVHIETNSNALHALKHDARKYVPVTIVCGSSHFSNVGCRLKGMGAFLPLDQKPSFALKFNEFVPRQRCLGFTKILLNNCLHDPTFVSEVLCNQLFREAGLRAPQAAFARVSFNGRDLGLYTMVEAINEPFLKREFGDGSGNLYEGVRQDVSDGLDQDNGTVADQSDLRGLAQAARITNATERFRELNKLLDIERFLSFVAMEMLLWHWDGYTMNRCNYRIYHDPILNKMVFIPHGMDQSFRDPKGSLWRPSDSLLVHALLSTEEGRKRYNVILAKLARTHFTLKSMNRRLEELAAILRPAICEAGEPALAQWEAAFAGFRQKITLRLESIHSQLERLKPEIQ